MLSVVNTENGRGEEGKGEKQRVLKIDAIFSEICLALILEASHSESAGVQISTWEGQRPLDLSVSDNSQTMHMAHSS